MIAMSRSIKGQGGKFGRCVAKAAVLTSGGLGRVPDSGLRRLLYHWPRIREQLLQGAYQPQPLKRVKIPKPGGGERPLGIPTVLDRFIQQAVMQVLQGSWDRTSSEPSYGFRPGRSAHQDVAQAQVYIAQGYG